MIVLLVDLHLPMQSVPIFLQLDLFVCFLNMVRCIQFYIL